MAPRIAWIDATRAICVLGVVLMHTVLTLQSAGVEIAPWRWFVDEMGPFRISALSMLSGLLLSRRIREGWSSLAARSSVALSVWLYVVWLLLFTLFATGVGSFIWTGPLGGGTTAEAWQAFASQLLLPRTVLWYVLALAIWTALLTTLHRADPALVLCLLFVLSLSAPFLPALEGSDQYVNVCRYAFFFALGVYGAPRLRAWIASHPERVLLGGVAGFAALRGLELVVSTETIDIAVTPARDTAAALALLAAIVFVCRIRPLERGLAWVGRRTLPIYVVHGLALEALILFPATWAPFLHEHAVARWTGPLVATLAIAAFAIALHTLALLTPARVLFTLPDPLVRLIRKEPR